jgi:hypothetical protein
VEAVVQALLELVSGPCEAVKDGAAKVRNVVPQERHESVVCISSVKKYGEIEVDGEFELGAKARFLDGPWREVAVEVEPTLPDSHHGGMLCQGSQLGKGIGGHSRRIVRVNPYGRVQVCGELLGESYALLAALQAGAGEDERLDTRLLGALDHLVSIGVKRPMREVDTDVNHSASMAC